MKQLVISSFFIALLLCSCNNGKTTESQVENTQTPELKESAKITAEMAYEGVNNYCHSEYDWSVAKDNPSMMYVKMGEETDAEYQVEFRSYTGAIVYFYVDKTSGATRMVEYVPNLDVKNEVGTINLFDFLKKE